MSKRVLWIDNEDIFIRPHIFRLRAEGYTVVQALSLTDGEQEIKKHQYDLLILDVMMNESAEEEASYPPAETDFGKKAGLLFYRRFAGLLARRGTKLLVLTVRVDPGIRREFLDAGLPAGCFVTKAEVRDTAVFLSKVGETLEG